MTVATSRTLLTPDRRVMLGQLVRYGLSGLLVTLLYALVYTGVAAMRLPLPPNLHLQCANLAGYLVAVVVGYFLHSRWSFRDHGTRDNAARTGGRFVAVSLFSLGCNALWTWLLVARLGWERHTPLAPIACATPLIMFWLQRRWVFR